MTNVCVNFKGSNTTCGCNFCETAKFHTKVKEMNKQKTYKVSDKVRWKLLPDTSRYEGEVVKILGNQYAVKLFYSGVELLFHAGELEDITTKEVYNEQQ